MTREIKFRAWDKVDQKLKNNIHLATHFEEYLQLQQFVVMKCTNLKDKNGKEIYEGDIVTQHLKRSTRLGEVNSEIIWYQDYCGFAIATISDDGTVRTISHMHGDIELEVIGNVCENPELLK